MNRKKFYLLLFLIIILCLYFIISSVISISADEIVFSADSGFYDNEFDLVLEASDGIIYYTLDGSEPTCDSVRYEAPIHIYDASANENVYCMRTDISPVFYSDVMEQYNTEQAPIYSIPDYRIDKCTVVRAVVYYGDDNYSDIYTKTYFVGYENKPGYSGIMTASIVTDPYYLFDYNDGIYVTGRAFDDFVADTIGTDACWCTDSFTLWTANYTKGIAKEVPCSFILMDENGAVVLSQNCAMKIHGGGSRSYNPKSLNLYAGWEYGEESFNYDFFGNGYIPGEITFSQGGDDYNAKIRDCLACTLAADMDVCTMHYRPCVMFLDGEYWGVYFITEKYNEEYLEYYYGVDSSNIIMIKNDTLEIGDVGDEVQWQQMKEFCTNSDMADPENYARACELVDIDSYIDYYALMIMVDRSGDWPGGNTAAWRSRKAASGEYNDCRWRWMVYDLNSSSMWHKSFDEDNLARTMEIDAMFANFMQNQDFKNAFLDRLSGISEEDFSQERVDAFIDEYEQQMCDALENDRKRFFGENTIANYGNIEYVRDFFELRREYISDLILRYR